MKLANEDCREWLMQVRFLRAALNFKERRVDNLKIVINKCFGGFGLSVAATEAYLERKGETEGSYFSDRDVERDDSDLVAVVESLGDAANGRFAQLAVVEIPDDVEWTVQEYDGTEWIAETHRTWG